MKYIKNYFLFLEGKTYEFGCVMMKINFDDWNSLKNMISPEDLHNDEEEQYGFETEPHLTLLYGLHKDVTTEQVKSILDTFELDKISIKINGIGNFENSDYDVLKFNVVKTDILQQIHEFLSEIPNSNKYPDYNPHITIAYLKKGTSKKYLNENFKMVIPKIESIIFSKPSGEKIEIKV